MLALHNTMDYGQDHKRSMIALDAEAEAHLATDQGQVLWAPWRTEFGSLNPTISTLN